jgi:hypothetical protein
MDQRLTGELRKATWRLGPDAGSGQLDDGCPIYGARHRGANHRTSHDAGALAERVIRAKPHGSPKRYTIHKHGVRFTYSRLNLGEVGTRLRWYVVRVSALSDGYPTA